MGTSVRFREVYLDANGNDASMINEHRRCNKITIAGENVSYLADNPGQHHARKLFHKAVAYGKLDVLQLAQNLVMISQGYIFCEDGSIINETTDENGHLDVVKYFRMAILMC